MQEVKVSTLNGSRKFKVVTEDGRTEFVFADKYEPHNHVGSAQFRVYRPGTVANADGFRASEVVASFRHPKQVTEVPIPWDPEKLRESAKSAVTVYGRASRSSAIAMVVRQAGVSDGVASDAIEDELERRMAADRKAAADAVARMKAAEAKAESDRAAAQMKELARQYIGRYPWSTTTVAKPKPKSTVVATLTIDGGGYADAKKTDMIRLLTDFCKRQSYGLDIISIAVEVVK
jgi:hypothetical protein